MYIVEPKQIELLESNIPENEHEEWDSSTNYNIGDICQIAEQHKIYKAAAENTNKNPIQNPKLWVSKSTNQRAMFDNEINTQTIGESEIKFKIRSSVIDTIALFNVSLDTATLTALNEDGSTYDTKELSFVEEELMNFGDYLFAPRFYATEMIIPVGWESFIGEIEITLKGSEERPPKIGHFIIGLAQNLGISLYQNSKIGFSVYGKQQRDDWGYLEFKQTITTDTQDIDVLVEKERIKTVKNRLKRLRGKATLFFVSPLEQFFVYGVYKDFLAPINPQKSIYTLQLESLV